MRDAAAKRRPGAALAGWGWLARGDIAAILLFGGIALMLTLGRWGGAYPFFLGSDASNIATWAAALDHPDLFAGDGSIGDPANFGFYFTVHVPLLRLLQPLTHDYGTSFLLLLFFHPVLQLVGFYALGRALFGDRFFAALFALLTLPTVEVNLYEVWGFLRDPLPRFGFQALLPFLLTGAVVWRRQPRRWPWLMLGAGLLMYVHPVSAPAWAFAVWLGLWAWRPGEWSRPVQAARMVALGGGFMLVSGPFLYVYLTGHAHGAAETVPFEAVYAVMQAMLPRAYLDAFFAVREFAAIWLDFRGLLWLAAALGVGLVLHLRPDRRERVALVGLWTAGLLAITLLGPLLDQEWTRSRSHLPTQIDLIRGLRYLVPLMLLFCVWPLAALSETLRAHPRRRLLRLGVAGVGLALLAAWSLRHPIREVRASLSCWASGQIVCMPAGWRTAAEAITHTGSDTPPGARVLPTRYAYALHIRYHALRPVVYSHRDLSALLYANHEALLDWHDRYLREEANLARRSVYERFEGHLALTRDFAAEYALLDWTHLPPNLPLRRSGGIPYETVWRNDRFALLRIPPPSLRGKSGDEG